MWLTLRFECQILRCCSTLAKCEVASSVTRGWHHLCVWPCNLAVKCQAANQVSAPDSAFLVTEIEMELLENGGGKGGGCLWLLFLLSDQN